MVKNRDSRVLKHNNYFADGYGLSAEESAVMNVLMLPRQKGTKNAATLIYLRVRKESGCRRTPERQVEQ
jgi:hypothetical protein